MFPVGVPPRGIDAHHDERGLDTINRLLLHGAGHHDRAALFVPGDTREEGGFSEQGRDVPDWQADRLSIRVALVLLEEISLQRGDRVALWMPLSLSWALAERALWGLGAASIPIPPELRASEVSVVLARARPRVLFVSSVSRASSLSIRDSVAAVVTLDPSASGGFGLALRELLDRGGVLDTPERASRFRAMARQIPPETLASIEPTSSGAMEETTQGDWARDAERFARRIAPRKGGRHVLARSGVERAARLVLYSGWADGLTTIAFSGEPSSGIASPHFANLFQVTGEENGGAP